MHGYDPRVHAEMLENKPFDRDLPSRAAVHNLPPFILVR
jgi:hypothetical protein